MTDIETPWDDAELERLGFHKEAISYSGPSRFLQAVNQTPRIWNRQQSVLQNLQQYLRGVWRQGKDNIQLAYSDEATRLAYSPDSARWDRMREYLRGQNPVISHPVDRLVERL